MSLTDDRCKSFSEAAMDCCMRINSMRNPGSFANDPRYMDPRKWIGDLEERVAVLADRVIAERTLEFGRQNFSFKVFTPEIEDGVVLDGVD